MRGTTLLPFLLLSLNVNAFFPNFPFPSNLIGDLFKGTQLTNCPVDHLSLSHCTLPAPSSDLKPRYVTLGRGTQNYTCESSNKTAVPASVGATATLFDASCIAAFDQTILHTLPDLLKRVPLSGGDFVAGLLKHFMGEPVAIGKHYFKGSDPFFDLQDSGSEDAWVRSKKDAAVDAPVQPGHGYTGDVAWLKLSALEGGLKEVYRVHTGGGEPPETCLGMPPSFTVDYVAEYWFYE